MTPQQRSRAPIVYALIGLSIALLVAGLTFLSSSPLSMAPPSLEADPSIHSQAPPPKTGGQLGTKPETQGMDAPSPTKEGPKPSSTSEAVQGLPSQASPAESAESKAEQPPSPMPRTTLVIDFPSEALPPGESRGITPGADGLKLATKKTSSNPRRVGTFTSEPIPLAFPANAIAPLWKADTPEGTELEIALSLSPEGEAWLPFRTAEADIDSGQAISPTYPDGRPNPFYGYTPGGVMAFGLSLFSHVRYRVTLYSEVDESPRLVGLRLYYQDTTLGRGHVATLPPPP